ncbi:MAG: hypothetical protein PVG03_03270 [Desulfarculaceae bacterium]
MNPYNLWVSNFFYLAAVLYLLGTVTLVWPRKKLFYIVIGSGFLANLISLGVRLYYSWPMQAPFQEPFWLPAGLAAFALGFTMAGRERLGRWLIPLAAGLAIYTALFPKDFYLPFPRSHTLCSHLFLFLSAAGRACLWAGGVEALLYLLGRGDAQGRPGKRTIFGELIIWGFVVFTLSLFTAETWSYLGWAAPVVWEEYTVTSTMGTWFYYGCFLHLYLLRQWPLRRRAWFALAGPVLMFYFNYLPETGELKLPVFL